MPMQMLCRELSLEKQQALSSLAHHPGYRVLRELIEEACRQAASDLIKLDPSEEGYDRRLAAAQSRARSINEFSAALIKSISVHCDSVRGENQ